MSHTDRQKNHSHIFGRTNSHRNVPTGFTKNICTAENKIRDVSRLDQCGLLSTQTGGRHRFVFSCIPILLPFPHPFLDAYCASISSTYPCTTVGRSVTLFLISILSASLSPNKASRSWWPTWWPTQTWTWWPTWRLTSWPADKVAEKVAYKVAGMEVNMVDMSIFVSFLIICIL